MPGGGPCWGVAYWGRMWEEEPAGGMPGEGCPGVGACWGRSQLGGRCLGRDAWERSLLGSTALPLPLPSAPSPTLPHLPTLLKEASTVGWGAPRH